MNINLCDAKSEWEAAIVSFPEANFLHAWQWGEFQQSLGKKVIRALLSEQQKTLGLAQVVLEKARRGTYYAIAGGPLIDWSNEALVAQFLDELVKRARQDSCDFIRFRPQALESAVSSALLTKLRAKQAPMHLTADLTIEIDLTQSEDALVKNMRKQHRQALRKAKELGIVVIQSSNVSDIESFYAEQLRLAQAQHFVPFSKRFLQQQFQAFVEDNQVALFHAYHKQTLLASAFVLFYNGTSVYHYGISTPSNAQMPGSYACQWEIMMESKRRGCTKYNLWGVAPKDATNHRFYGVGLFKRGFGGVEVPYLPAQDIAISWKYPIIRMFELVRKTTRRL